MSMEPDDQEFIDLIRRVRLGEPEAAGQLIRQFEPEIRRKIRTWIRMRHPDLRSIVETMDIYQSVLANFFVRAASGQFDLDDPERVLGLLVVMARNKLNSLTRDHRRQRRDLRRTESLGDDAGGDGGDPSPSRIVAGRELLALALSRLSEEERRVVDLRTSGSSWDAVATDLGGTPEGRRKQLARALSRVAHELGIDDTDGRID